MARCRYPHPAFHIPGIRSRPGDPIARPPAGTSPREGALPRSASAKFAPKVVAILRTSSGGGTPKRRPCAPNKGSRPCIVSWAGHWQCTCGSTQKLWANCSCGQPAPCREWARGSCQLGDRCKHPHPDFNVPAGLPRSTSAIVRPLPAMEMQSPFSETPVSPMGQFPPVTTWSSLEGLSGVDHTLARTSGRRKASGEMSLARSNVEQAPGEENIVAPSSLGGTSLASESDERPMNASEATTPLAPSPRGWPLFETNPGWSTTKVSEDNDKTWHHQLEQGKISTAASSPKDWRGRLVSLAGKDAWSGGAHVEGSTRSFSSSSVDWMMLSPLGSTPPRPELSWSDPPGSGRPLEAELVLDSVLPPQRLTLTSSHVVSGQPKCLSTHFQSSRGVKGVNEKVGNGLATTSEDASQPTALHQVGVTLLEAGLLDPAFFFALSTCKFLPLWPALGVLTAFEKQQRCERWNSAIDVYIGGTWNEAVVMIFFSCQMWCLPW